MFIAGYLLPTAGYASFWVPVLILVGLLWIAYVVSTLDLVERLSKKHRGAVRGLAFVMICPIFWLVTTAFPIQQPQRFPTTIEIADEVDKRIRKSEAKTTQPPDLVERTPHVERPHVSEHGVEVVSFHSLKQTIISNETGQPILVVGISYGLNNPMESHYQALWLSIPAGKSDRAEHMRGSLLGKKLWTIPMEEIPNWKQWNDYYTTAKALYPSCLELVYLKKDGAEAETMLKHYRKAGGSVGHTVTSGTLRYRLMGKEIQKEIPLIVFAGRPSDCAPVMRTYQ